MFKMIVTTGLVLMATSCMLTNGFQTHLALSSRFLKGRTAARKMYSVENITESVWFTFGDKATVRPKHVVNRYRKRRDIGKDLFLENSRDNLALLELYEASDKVNRRHHHTKYQEMTSLKDTFDNLVLSVEEQAARKTVNSVMSTSSDTLVAKSAEVHHPPAKIEAPSVRKILRFAIPAIGVWLCDPLLSLIDTCTVGMFSGTISQAALTPACAVTDYAALLMAFVFTATTNLIAAAKEKDRGVSGSPRTIRSLVGSLQLATYVGALLGLVVFLGARPLVQAIVGKAHGVDPAVVDAAAIYVRIRSLGMPAAVQIGCAQAACLGMHDIRSQFKVLAAAAIVNVVADLLLVGNPNPWIGGAAGAAWGTIFSQYVAVSYFLHWLCHKGNPKAGSKGNKIIDISNAILKFTRKNSTEHLTVKNRASASKMSTHSLASAKIGASVFRRGFLEGHVPKGFLLHFPSRETIKKFKPYVLPVTFAQVGRVSGYVFMSYVVASSLGTLALAAQQIIASLVFCLLPVADSLSLTGQAFVPPIAEKGASRDRAIALRETMINLSKAAGIFGLFTALMIGLTPAISGYFTSDPLVINMVNGVVPLLAASFPVYALVMALEGFLLGRKDLGFQGKMYTAWCFILPFFMLNVKRAALNGAQHVGIKAVWGVLFGYQVVRFVSWLGRFLILQRRTELEVERLQLVPQA